MADSLPTKDEAFARLETYQQRLDEAAAQGPVAYGRLFDNAPPGICLHEIDAQGTVRRVNPREVEVLGRPAEEMLGKPVWQFSVMVETAQRAVEKKLSGGGLKPFVRTLTRADQTPVMVAMVERYLHDAKGEIAGIRTSFMPIRG
jgi:PAS domain-containing protein